MIKSKTRSKKVSKRTKTQRSSPKRNPTNKEELKQLIKKSIEALEWIEYSVNNNEYSEKEIVNLEEKLKDLPYLFIYSKLD